MNRSLLQNLLRVTLPSLLLLGLIFEIIFRFLIVASNRPDSYFDEEHGIVKFAPVEIEGLYTIGNFAQQQGRWHTNAQGWNSTINYQSSRSAKPRCAILGDSYVEALQVDVDKGFPNLLRKSLKEQVEVYSFGRSGAPLSHYLHLARYVARVYNPDLFIITVVANDYDNSIASLNPFTPYFMRLNLEGSQITEVPPSAYPTTSWTKWLKKSALFRYIHYNLRLGIAWRGFWEGRDRADLRTAPEELVYQHKDDVERAIYYLFNQFRSEFADARVVFVLDGPRPGLYNEPLDNLREMELHAMMKQAADKVGIQLIDLSAPMKKDFDRNGNPYNSEYDLHWNEFGHQFVAEQLLKKVDFSR